jgi:hypothetical protein
MARNKPLIAEELIAKGTIIADIPDVYIGVNKSAENATSSAISEQEMTPSQIIDSKVFSLDQQSHLQVLAESNTGYSNGYITTQEFKGASDTHYVYGIPLNHSWTGSSVVTNKMDTRKASAGTNTTNEEKYVQTDLDTSGAYFTQWDYTYIDHIDVGITLPNGTIAADYASEKFLISIYAGALGVDDIYNEPATWFAVSDGLSIDVEADTTAKHRRAEIKNKTPFTEHASVKIRPLSTTPADYNTKYFYISDGKGNRCKFTFNSSIGTHSRTSAHNYIIGVGSNSTLAHMAADIAAGINKALNNAVFGTVYSECKVFAKVNGDTVEVYNIEPGYHGNQGIETDIANTVLKFTPLDSTDERLTMEGGISADPVNQIVGNDSYPLATFSNHPLAAKSSGDFTQGGVSFTNMEYAGQSEIGIGLYHLGKVNTSQVIEFPSSLGGGTGFMAVAKIPVKMLFRYAGTPILAGLKYAGTVPADLDSDGGATDTQNILTQARVYGGVM